MWELAGQTLLFTSSGPGSPRPALALALDPDSGLVAAGCGSLVTVAAATVAPGGSRADCGSRSDRWTDVGSTELDRPPPEGEFTNHDTLVTTYLRWAEPTHLLTAVGIVKT